MKSKSKILVVIFNLLLVSMLMNFGVSEEPQTQASYETSLGFEIDEYYEFYCTEMDSTELNNVFGADWVTDLASYIWISGNNAPSNIGDKTRFLIDDVTNLTTSWILNIDQWDWTPKASTYGAQVVNDVSYDLPFNSSGYTFNPSIWILALPVVDYIAMGMPGVFSSSANEIYYNGTDVADYQVGWIYDVNNGIVKNFWIKDGNGDTIYEMWGFELKLNIAESYNWIVTTFNQGQLSSVFGPNWENDINAYCWWALDAPILNGEKSMFLIDLIDNHASIDDWYTLDVDGWNWKDKELLHGSTPDRNDAPYNLPMDPEGVAFTYSLFMIPTPVVRYLDLLTYDTGYTHDANVVRRSTSDELSYNVVWTFDEGLGVVDSFQIRNSAGSTIFQIILMEIKLPPETTFEWEVTKVDETGLEAVLGTDWEANIQSSFGSGCNETGAKSKRIYDNVTLPSSTWYIYYRQWYWTRGAYDAVPNVTSSTSLFCNPEDGFWGAWMWMIPFPAEYYLLGRGYVAGTKLETLTVTQNATDVQDYQFVYTYDAILGVFSKVQLLDNVSTVVFEYQLVSVEAPPDGFIPGYDTILIVSSIFLMVGFISLITLKRKFKKY